MNQLFNLDILSFLGLDYWWQYVLILLLIGLIVAWVVIRKKQ